MYLFLFLVKIITEIFFSSEENHYLCTRVNQRIVNEGIEKAVWL